MNPYLAGLLTFPLAIALIWLTGNILVRAWDAWEKLLSRLRPWKPRENGRVAAIVALAPAVWVMGLPGAAVIFVHAGKNPLNAARLNHLGWKIDTLATETVEETQS